MASFFSKFVSGAAKGGAELLVDQMMQQTRADLTSKRDAMLHQNRLSLEAEKSKLQQLTPQSRLANVQLTAAENLASLQEQYTALDPADKKGRLAIAKDIIAAQGKPIEATTALAAEKSRLQQETPQGKIAALKLESTKRMIELQAKYAALDPSDTEGRLAVAKDIIAAKGAPYETTMLTRAKAGAPKDEFADLTQKYFRTLVTGQKDALPSQKEDLGVLLDMAKDMAQSTLGGVGGGSPTTGIILSSLTPEEKRDLVQNDAGDLMIKRDGAWLTVTR